MKKINKKSINYSLKILAILAFSLIFMPARVWAGNNDFLGGFGGGSGAAGSYPYAYTSNSYSGSDSYYYNNGYGNSYNYNQVSYQPPVYIPPPAPEPTSIVYSNSVNPNVASTTTVPRTVARTTNTPSTVASSASTTSSDNYSGLAASAFYGIGSFLPSGLVQWVIFAILILLLVILTRTIFGAKENYHATPLKHD